MKKYLFLIATAAIVASCSDMDTFKKDIQNNNGVIEFSSYSQLTTKAENSSAIEKYVFFNHHTTFKVWGYKNTEVPAVFAGDVVTVAEATPSGYTYSYSPLRYWDKAATTYRFYAAAPADGGWDFQGVSNDESTQNQAAGYFKTTSTITGVNLKATTPSESLSEYFKDKQDVDKLIAEPCAVNKSKFGIEPVQLDFIHILSKMNVSIKKDNKLSAQTVTLKSFEIVNLFNKGNFDENTSVANLADGSNVRWTKADGAGSVTYSAKTNWEITTKKNYIVESLVIPQNAEVELVALDGKHHDPVPEVKYSSLTDYNAAYSSAILDDTQWTALNVDNQTTSGYNTATSQSLSDDQFNALVATLIKEPAVPEIAAVGNNSKPYFKIVYTIQDGDNTPETFTAYYNLATAFKGLAVQASTVGFYEGWQNTLNININPDEIEFCADVYKWATKKESGLDIE